MHVHETWKHIGPVQLKLAAPCPTIAPRYAVPRDACDPGRNCEPGDGWIYAAGAMLGVKVKKDGLRTPDGSAERT
jgi:hypothetical protein